MRGIKSKLNELKASICDSDYDVIAVTETWLNSSVYTSEFCGSYNVFRKDRDGIATGKSQGGGVFLAIGKHIKAREVDIFKEINDFECICVQSSGNFGKFYIIVVYVIPNNNVNYLKRFYECCEENLLHEKYIIFGDFNIPEYILDVNSERLLDLKQFLNFCNLKQYNIIKNSQDRILDLILSNMPVKKVAKGSIPLLVEDNFHPCLEISVKIKNNLSHSRFNTKVQYNFKRGNYELLYREMQNVDWLDVLNKINVNDAVNAFYNVIYGIFDICIPKAKHSKRKYPIWYNSTIIKNIKKKDKFRKKYNKTKQDRWKLKYTEYRHLVKSQSTTAYEAYQKNVQNELKSNPKSFWQFVKNQKITSDIPDLMIFNNKEFSEPANIVNAFAEFFSSVYTNNNFCSISNFKQEPYSGFGFIEITELELRKAVKKVKVNKSVANDSLPVYIVKGCIDFLIKPLLFIFNLCLKNGTYPSKWKESKVIPIFKNGYKNNIKNYRSVCIVSVCSKILEIIISNRIFESVKNRISNQQHGFLPQHSTATNLINFSQYIHESLKNGYQVDVIYTDLEKAFDKVDFNEILRALEDFSIDTNIIVLLLSYLCNRTYFVEHQGFSSKSYTPTSGVPQGSNLGPLLFLLVINNIGNNNRFAEGLIFADDYKVFYMIKCQEDAINLQKDLNTVVGWCREHNFNLNIDKCAVMTFACKTQTVDFDYKIDEVRIKKTTVQKDLGIYFDPKLNFNIHVNGITASAVKILGFIIRSCKLFDNVNTIISLYKSLVVAKMLYAGPVWDPYYANKINAMESVQRKFVKFLYYKMHYVYPQRGTDQRYLCNMFNIYSLKLLRTEASLVFMYKMLSNQIINPNFLERLPFRVGSVNTRNGDLFYINQIRTNMYKNSPLIRLCLDFNKYCRMIDIFNISLNKFKTEVRTILQYYNL